MPGSLEQKLGVRIADGGESGGGGGSGYNSEKGSLVEVIRGALGCPGRITRQPCGRPRRHAIGGCGDQGGT